MTDALFMEALGAALLVAFSEQQRCAEISSRLEIYHWAPSPSQYTSCLETFFATREAKAGGRAPQTPCGGTRRSSRYLSPDSDPFILWSAWQWDSFRLSSRWGKAGRS